MAAIGTIRDKFGWFLVVIMVISLIAFLLMGIGGNGNGNVSQVNNELGIVNGEVISNLDFEDNLSANITNYQNQTRKQELTDNDMTYLRNATYNQLLTDKLLEKVYDNTGIKVSDAEFVDMLSGNNIHPSIKQSFVDSNGVFSRDILRNFLANLDIENANDEPGTKRKSWNTFEKAIVKERLDKKYTKLIEKSFTVPTFMANDEYVGTKSQTTFNYVRVPYASIADSTLNITDQDITSYINKHPKKYEQEASVDLKYVQFDIVPSENDVLDILNEMNKKTEEWKETEAEKDSAFISLYSDIPFDNAYYGKDELINNYKDTLFKVEKGTVFGPDKVGDAFISYKLIDKKMIADSLKARHLLISFEDIKSQEEYDSKLILVDSLWNLVDSLGYELSSLTSQFSEDQSNANNGGDLNWVKPNQMVPEFNNMIFFNMKEGDVRKVATKFGLHIVQVYKADLTKEAVKVATLKNNIEASSNTQDKIYSKASSFSGNNATKEKFIANEATINIVTANSISRESSSIQNITGAREIIKWAFKAENGEVSMPFSIGETYYVVLVDNKNEKGVIKLNDNNRIFLTSAVAKEKKGEILKEKMNGADLNTIATNNGVTVELAENISFSSPIVGGSSEPIVAGASLGIAENTVSKPLIGNDGVYVIKVTSKTTPQEDISSLEATKTQLSTTLITDLSNKIKESLKKAADIKDNRFNFF